MSEPRANAAFSAATMDVQTSIEIDRPAAEVASFAGDPDNVPRWYVNIKSVEWVTPRPVAVGARIAFVAHFAGRRLAYTHEVVELVPGARLVMQTSEGPFPMETSYIWEPIGPTRTRMTLRNRGAPAGFSRLFAPLLAWMVRRENRADLARLKRRLEAGSDE
jgi:uncharacterized membrane protein